MEFNSFGPAVGRLGSDSSRGGPNSAKVEAGGLRPPHFNHCPGLCRVSTAIDTDSVDVFDFVALHLHVDT